MELSEKDLDNISYRELINRASEKLPPERIDRFACDCALLSVELIKPYVTSFDLIVNCLKAPDKYDCRTSARVATWAYDAASLANRSSTWYDRWDNAQRAGWAVVSALACHAATEEDCWAKPGNAESAALEAIRAVGSKEEVNQLLIDMFKEF